MARTACAGGTSQRGEAGSPARQFGARRAPRGNVLHVDVAGKAGRLEALWEEPAAPARAAAVVCHPHPLHGGTMHTHAVHRIARAARGRGIATLRFQFRGVGLSQGSHDGGRGERDDVRAALAFAAERAPGLPQLLAGFSFGAWMAVEVGCDHPEVRAILAAGLSRTFEMEGAIRRCRKPLAVVQAELDEFSSPAEVEAALAGSAGPRRLAVVPGASHLFGEDLPALEREADRAFGWLLEAA